MSRQEAENHSCPVRRSQGITGGSPRGPRVPETNRQQRAQPGSRWHSPSPHGEAHYALSLCPSWPTRLTFGVRSSSGSGASVSLWEQSHHPTLKGPPHLKGASAPSSSLCSPCFFLKACVGTVSCPSTQLGVGLNFAGKEWPGAPNSGSGKHCSHLRFLADTQEGDPTLHILFSHHKEEKYSISQNKLLPIQIAIFKCTNKVQAIKSSSGFGGPGKRRRSVLAKASLGVPAGGGAGEDPAPKEVGRRDSLQVSGSSPAGAAELTPGPA